jgi:hypothetical protein
MPATPALLAAVVIAVGVPPADPALPPCRSDTQSRVHDTPEILLRQGISIRYNPALPDRPPYGHRPPSLMSSASTPLPPVAAETYVIPFVISLLAMTAMCRWQVRHPRPDPWTASVFHPID